LRKPCCAAKVAPPALLCRNIRLCAWGGARSLPLVDLWLFDLKEIDPRLHEHHRQAELTDLASLRQLHAGGVQILLRCPLIPTTPAGDLDKLNAAELRDAGECAILHLWHLLVHRRNRNAHSSTIAQSVKRGGSSAARRAFGGLSRTASQASYHNRPV
jgi:hypothetical protein